MNTSFLFIHQVQNSSSHLVLRLVVVGHYTIKTFLKFFHIDGFQSLTVNMPIVYLV